MDIEIIELETEIEIIQLEIEIYQLENEMVEVFVNPIECKECFKIFSASSTLKLHKSIKHADNSIKEQESDTVYYVSNPIKCNICSKTFSAISTLELHEDLIHGIINSGKSIQTSERCRKLNTCNIFWKTFEKQTNLINFNNSKSRKEFTTEHCKIHEGERFGTKCSIEKDFCDVSLACKDKHFSAHKFIVSTGCKMRISKRKDEQNYIFQIF